MKIIGHRGAQGLAPENTLQSIEKALALGVDEVEFDVRVTADGIPILHHDAAVRIGGEKLLIVSSTYSELKTHKPGLCTLKVALERIGAKCTPLIEVKHAVDVSPIIDVLEQFLGKTYAADQLLLGSKSQKTLLELHKELPAVPKVVIEPWSGIRATWRAHQVGTKRLNMRSWWLWIGFLRPMHNRGWQIAAYTMNDPKKVRRWQPYLYAVITDFPDLFQK